MRWIDIDVEQGGEVAVVWLDRPAQHNALSTAVERDLLTALASDQVSRCRCLVLAGRGRSFCAGADVTEVRGMDQGAVLEYYRDSGRVYEALASLRQPTVSAVHGYCLGGGFELALATDFRVADATARLGFPEVGLGILPSSGGAMRVTRACGPLRAREVLLLGRRLDAAEARGYGLVTEVVAEGTALARALELAAELSRLPATAVEVVRQVIDVAAQSPDAAALLVERLAYATLNATAEAADRQAGFGRPR